LEVGTVREFNEQKSRMDIFGMRKVENQMEVGRGNADDMMTVQLLIIWIGVGVKYL